MKARIGDRFEYIGKYGPYSFEVLALMDEDLMVECYHSENKYWFEGRIVNGYPNPIHNSQLHDGYKYLGNFSKSNQFKTIYEILNSSNDADSGI
jgi:hypothetical protein